MPVNSDAGALAFYIALAGPTASGKTAAALAIANQFPCEIISVDSALVYRGMDIGSAKPSLAERAQTPHHLIDIRDPLHAYSAAEFVRDARALIQTIHAKGKIPLLVGGTMLYFKALADGLDDMPPANAALRQTLEQEALQRGWPALHAELALADPETAQRLAPNDSQRIQRALEVLRLTGLPLSHFHHRARRSMDAPDGTQADKHLLVSLEPTDRAVLHARIEARFDAMMAAGFLEEVQALRQRGDLHRDLPSIRCVGYRQAWEALDGEFAMGELATRATAATRQLAKRQLTWLRSMPHRQIIPCDQPDGLTKLIRCVQQALQAHAQQHPPSQ